MLNENEAININLDNNFHETSILGAGENVDLLTTFTVGMDIIAIDIDKLVDAPKDWNFYGDLPIDKMEELVDSIRANGLLVPLIVWEQEDGTYMILSGHNRKNAIVQLLEEYKTYFPVKFEEEKMFYITNEKIKPVFNLNFIATLVDTKRIHCFVKKINEISEEGARDIIVDTNWVQRILTTMQKANSIIYKYTSIGRKQKAKNGEGKNEGIRDIIAAQYKLKGRQVSNYLRLNYLIPEFQEQLQLNNLSIKAGVVLSQFPQDMQNWIYNKYGETLCNKNILHLKKEMTKLEIKKIFSNIDLEDKEVAATISYDLVNDKDDNILFEKYVEILPVNDLIVNTIDIPKNLQTSFKMLILKFLKENSKDMNQDSRI